MIKKINEPKQQSVKFSESHAFLVDRSTLKLKDASCAIILTSDKGFLLQLRDNKKGIFFPGHWGFFGGAIERNETPKQAIIREIKEEINLDIDKLDYLFNINFNFSDSEDRTIKRHYFEIQLAKGDLNTIKLAEGESYKVFTKRDAISLQPFWSLDAYALWLYMNKGRIN